MFFKHQLEEATTPCFKLQPVEDSNPLIFKNQLEEAPNICFKIQPVEDFNPPFHPHFM